jgi:hypothetical protein
MTKLIYLFIFLLTNSTLRFVDNQKLLDSNSNNRDYFFTNQIQIMKRFSDEIFLKSNKIFEKFFKIKEIKEVIDTSTRKNTKMIQKKSFQSFITSTSHPSDINVIIVPVEKKYVFKMSESIYIYGIALILLAILIIIIKLIMLFSKNRSIKKPAKETLQINENSDYEDVLFDIRYINDLKQNNQNETKKLSEKNLDFLNLIKMDIKKKIEEKMLNKFQNSNVFQHHA